jgi:Putative peptidoglycan binding domain
MFSGIDVLRIAESRVGEEYILGARVPMDNPNFHGPWDCAEFVSWSVYQTYRILMGVRPSNPATADAYTGYWSEDVANQHAAIDVALALKTPGAILLRRPRAVRSGEHAIGHIALSRGDGSTVEARGRAFGVVIAPDAADRVWDTGVFVPGVSYVSGPAANYRPPANLLRVTSPFMQGPEIVAVQRALEARGYSVSGVDGVYGSNTEAAVYNFQAQMGTATDGVVGKETAGLLKLAWPIAPDADDKRIWEAATHKDNARLSEIAMPVADQQDARPANAGAPEFSAADLAPAAARSAADIASFEKKAGTSDHYVVMRNGSKFYVGTETHYKDDMDRRGLFQPSRGLANIRAAGVYDRAAAADVVGKIAHLIWPTVMAESSCYFSRLNSYDRAAFTYGCYQAAAHTPNANLIVLFRLLLGLDSASRYFPDLKLVRDSAGVPRVHQISSSGTERSLETARQVVRPNGKTETQLADFMSYLNSDPQVVDNGELTAGARLYLWLLDEPEAREAQIKHAAQTARMRIEETRKAIPSFKAEHWQQVIWVNDIRHQGRGGYAIIKRALESSDPISELAKIGAKAYAERVKTVSNCITELERAGVLDQWTPADLNF